MEKGKFNWASLIGPGITLVIVLSGVLVTFTQLQSQSGFTEQDVKTVKQDVECMQEDVLGIDRKVTINTSEIKNIKEQINPISTGLKELKGSVQDLQLNNASFQSQLTSDINYIKEAIVELKQRKDKE